MESHPTTIPPPLPENSPPSPSSPPPQNPHTPPDASDFDCFQKGESSSSRNKENLKSLVLKLAGRMFPAHQSFIGRRFDDIFPDELLVPDHPPYADMILTAIWELKAEGGSSEEAISDYIKNEYHELPWAHATILNHHLKDLCIKGKITMTQDKCYSRCSSITKPKPVTIHSPCSSSSASLCSSPSSSSTSFCWVPPYKTHKRKRNRKNTMGRRGGGRGRGRGGPRGMIRVRKRGVLCNRNAIKIEEESEQATEDQNGVEETEDETKVMAGQKVNGNVKEKGESAGLRRSERRKNDVNEGNVACEQGQKRKHYNVVWIGRGVRKVNDQYDDVIEVEDDVMIDNDAEVVEQLEQKEEERETNVEQNQLVENQQCEKQNDDDDTVKEQIIVEEVKQPKKYSLRSCVKNQVENEKVEEQAAEANQKEIVLASSTVQQNLEININESEDEQLELQKEVKVVEDEHKQVEEEQYEGLFNGQQDSLTTQAESEEGEQEIISDHDDDTVKEQIILEEVKQPRKYSLRSCVKNRVENEKAESVEEHEAEVNPKEIVLVTGTTMQPNNESEDEHKQEEQNEAVFNGQHDSLTKKSDSEGDNEEHKNSENVTSELQEDKVPLKQRLRSSCKEQEQTPINKKQVEPVRRILRSGKAILKTPEVSERLEGNTRSSKRKPKIETEQVSSSRKTRRTDDCIHPTSPMVLI